MCACTHVGKQEGEKRDAPLITMETLSIMRERDRGTISSSPLCVHVHVGERRKIGEVEEGLGREREDIEEERESLPPPYAWMCVQVKGAKEDVRAGQQRERASLSLSSIFSFSFSYFILLFLFIHLFYFYLLNYFFSL